MSKLKWNTTNVQIIPKEGGKGDTKDQKQSRQNAKQNDKPKSNHIKSILMKMI